MHPPEFIVTSLRLALHVAGLLLPGTMLLRALRLPWSLAAAFAASVATLYALILILAWTQAAVSLPTLAAGLVLVTLLSRLAPARPPAAQISPSLACFTRMGWWLPLYAVFWSIVVYRLGFQPLSGPDTTFRWSWLAEQMLHFGTLDFYPPRSAEDFVRYFWAESIPPGVAGLYAWAYACGGSTHALWTSPVVALQLLALHELVWRLGSRWGGEAVARRAVLLAAACPLLTWAVLLGQETGLTALAVTGLVWSLAHRRDADGDRWVVLAAIFAVVAASAREYGPVFPLAAITGLMWLRAPRRQVLLLAAVSLPMALAWPLRAWVLTGNPVYSLGLAGLFPTNEVFTQWNDTLRGPAGTVLGSAAGWLGLGRYWLLWALPATVGAGALVLLLARGLREAWLMAAFAGLCVLLWFTSVAYTAGGLFYSLRVLSPAFALLTVAASYGAARLAASPVGHRFAAISVALVLLESLPKTLVLPENPYRASPRDWLQAANQVPLLAHTWDEQLLHHVAPLPDRHRVVSDYVGAPKLLARIGTEVAPLWSPEVSWLFDAKLKPEEIAARWRRSGLRYLILLKSGPTASFVQTHARWRTPHFTLKTLVELDAMIVLEAVAPGTTAGK